MAMGRPSEGAKPPEVTRPMTTPSALAISAPSRAGALPSSARPTRCAGHALDQFALDPRRAGKAAFFAPALGDRPVEAGLDRAGGRRRCHGRRGTVRLRAAANRGRRGRSARPPPPAAVRRRGRRRGLGGHGNLEAVLAGIAGARNEQCRAAPGENALRHEGERGDAGKMALQHGGRRRPLQGEQRAILQDFKPQIRQLGAQMGEIGRLAGGVDDQEQPFARRVGRRACVTIRSSRMPPSLIGELGVADAPRRERQQMSPGTRLSSLRAASRPDRKACPMCDTSNRPALSRVNRCSARTPLL